MTLVNVWIWHMQTQGYRVVRCLECGDWIAQKQSAEPPQVERSDRPIHSAGRPRIICYKMRCALARAYQWKNGRAAPPELMAAWKREYGDITVSESRALIRARLSKAGP